MGQKCYFCHGVISSYGNDHILLNDHGDHEVYMHDRCAAGQDVIRKESDAGDRVEITCPKCGEVEVH